MKHKIFDIVKTFLVFFREIFVGGLTIERKYFRRIKP